MEVDQQENDGEVISQGAEGKIFDVMGKLVSTQGFDGLTNSISLSDMPKGHYYLMITKGDQKLMRKFIVN